MGSVDVSSKDGIAQVILDKSITNPIDLDLVKALKQVLDDLRDDPSIRGLVLTSSNEKFFCIGFELPELIKLDRKGVQTFYSGFNDLCLDLYTMPKPTVAAMKGHAIAGGCILALCCDYRVMAEGRKLMGLNEVKLGLPVPYPAHCILGQVVGDRCARDIMESGEFFRSDSSLQMGMVDKVLPMEKVLPEAMATAKVLGRHPSMAYRTIKENRVRPLEKVIREGSEEWDRRFLEAWFLPRTLALLKEASKRF